MDIVAMPFEKKRNPASYGARAPVARESPIHGDAPRLIEGQHLRNVSLLACLACVDVDECLTVRVENLETACPTSRGFVGPASAKQGPDQKENAA